jgi:hypothetical protein
VTYNLDKMAGASPIVIVLPPTKPEPNVLAAAAVPTPHPTDENIAPKKVVIHVPEGFQPPPGTQVGESFGAVATCSLTENGDLCIEALDGCNCEANEEPEVIKNDRGILETLKQVLPKTGLPF